MFPISLLSFSVHSLSPEPSCSIFSFSFFIVSIVFCSLILSSFHRLQFLSNLAQYSLLYLLSNHPNNFLAVNCPGNSPFLNVPSSLSCFLTPLYLVDISSHILQLLLLHFLGFPSLPRCLILLWIPSIVPGTSLFLVSSTYSGFFPLSTPFLPQLLLGLVVPFFVPLPALHIFIFY